ncbi:MAG TPA: pyridoxamine 5'-phosphate oxidase family protein [Polyangiaceae bacterium]|nr:pyridoxamine 5'-phosphate oxidase family protein [Polyangiaceae bacterium]
MLGELTDREIDEVLRSEMIGRIGCVADGWPYVVPVTYVYDGESDSVYLHSGEGLKLRAMRDDPRVCFEVEQIRGAREWRTVVARGRFEPLWRDANNAMMNLLAARFTSTAPSASATLGRDEGRRFSGPERPAIYRLRFVEKTGRFEAS